MDPLETLISALQGLAVRDAGEALWHFGSLAWAIERREVALPPALAEVLVLLEAQRPVVVVKAS